MRMMMMKMGMTIPNSVSFAFGFKKNKHSISFIEQFELNLKSRHYCHFFHQPHSCCSSLTAQAHNKSLYK